MHVPPIGWGTPTTQTTTYLTATSGSNQTYSVPANFVANVSVEVVSAGGNGSVETTDGCGNGNGDDAGGGSGGYAKKSAVPMIAGGTQTYRLRDRGANSGATNACWFGGTTLSGSAVGIECGTNAGGSSPGSGAVTTGAIGDTVTAGNTGSGPGGGSTAPPAAAVTAASGSSVTNAGTGGVANSGNNGVQGIIKIVNLISG